MRHFLFIVHGAYFSSVTDLVARREFFFFYVCKRIIQALEVTALVFFSVESCYDCADCGTPRDAWCSSHY